MFSVVSPHVKVKRIFVVSENPCVFRVNRVSHTIHLTSIGANEINIALFRNISQAMHARQVIVSKMAHYMWVDMCISHKRI